MSAFKSQDSFELNPSSIQIAEYLTVQTVTEVTGYNLQHLRPLLRAGKLTGLDLLGLVDQPGRSYYLPPAG